MASKYRVAYLPEADQVRRSLPIKARTALAVKMRAIAANPLKYGRGGVRSLHETFGGGYGLVWYLDNQRDQITVTQITWAK